MEKTVLKLATPNDLEDHGRQKISEKLNGLIADAFALYVKTKNFHWHVSGPHFRDYHLLFDEQAIQIYAMIDILAERVRKLGKTTVRSIGHISQLQTLTDNDEAFVTPQSMLHELLEDNRKFIANIQKTHEVASDNQDAATTSILEGFIDETERRVWFLFETLAS